MRLLGKFQPRFFLNGRFPYVILRSPYSLSHTLPDTVNGRPTENKIFNPFVSVSMRFLSISHSAMSVSHSANALLIRRGPFNPSESFVHVQNLEWTTVKKAPAECTVAMRWHVFYSECVRSLSCTCPVRIR